MALVRGKIQIRTIYHLHMKRQNYNPTGCNDCKYKDTCNHKTNLLETLCGRKQITYFNKQSFISVDESVAQVSSELNAALKKIPQIYI